MAANRKSQNRSHATSDTMVWVIVLIISIFSAVAPFQMGYFNGAGLHGANLSLFEKKLMYGLGFGLIGLTVVIIVFARYQLFQKKIVVLTTGLILPLVYLISSLQAYSPYLSKISILLSVIFFSFYAMGIVLSDLKKALRALYVVFIFVGYLIVIYGFMLLFGISYIPDALSFDYGVRLASVFTYSNANAAFLLILLMGSLLRISAISGKKEVFVHIFMLIPITSSLMMTLSRSAMIMLPIIGLVLLLMVNFRRQLTIIGYMALSLMLSLVITPNLLQRGTRTYEKVSEAISTQQPLQLVGPFSSVAIGGWLRLFVASLAMVVIVFLVQKYAKTWIEKYLYKFMTRKSSRLYVPAVMVIVAIAGFTMLASGVLSGLLPNSINGRIDNFTLKTHSVLERITIYGDAIKLWSQRPILGGGGGAWEARYEQYQSYPYLNAQTHSYPVQLLVEVGLIGLLLILGFIVFIAGRYIWHYFRREESEREDSVFYFMMSMTILIYSIIDFEMSYAYMGALVFLGLGVLAGCTIDQQKRTWMEKKIVLRLTTVGLSAIVIAGLVFGSVKIVVVNKLEESNSLINNGSTVDAILAPVQSGLSIDNGHPILLDRMLTVNLQAFKQSGQQPFLNTAIQYAKYLEDAEPYYKNLVHRKYGIALAENKREVANQILTQAIEQYPYELTFYQQAVEHGYALWNEAQKANHQDQAQKNAEWITNIVSKAQVQIEKLNQLPKEILYIRKFEVTPNMYLAAGEVNFFAGEYKKVVDLLEGGIPESLSTDDAKNIALYYVASQHKLGIVNNELMHKLEQADPTMLERLEKLLKKG